LKSPSPIAHLRKFSFFNSLLFVRSACGYATTMLLRQRRVCKCEQERELDCANQNGSIKSSRRTHPYSPFRSHQHRFPVSLRQDL